MRTLSILQPFAWLIIRPDIVGEEDRRWAYEVGAIKDVENRIWPSGYKGEFLVHAGQTYSRRAHDEYTEFFRDEFKIQLPPYEAMPRGGIVGRVEMFGCEKDHSSIWKIEGQYGFLLRNAVPLPFIPWKVQLKFFDVPDAVVAGALAPRSTQ